MNNTSGLVYDEGNQLFRDVNSAMVNAMVPVVALLYALMTSGLVGNISVCYYFGFKIKRSSFSYFILVLSAFDIVMCAVGMPMEIIDLSLFYTFQNVIACKTLKLLDAFVAIGSLLTLLVIGVDRFRRICFPFQTQIGNSQAKILSVCVAVTSLALSWPTWILYGIQDVAVITGNGTVIGKDCTFTKNSSDRGYLIAMFTVFAVLFAIVVVSLLAMYLMIVRAIFKQKKIRKSYLSVSMTSHVSKVHTSGTKKTPTKSPTAKQFLRSASIPNFEISIDKKTAKFALLMLAITVAVLLGFVPYLALSVWRILQGKQPSEVLSRSEMVGFQVGIRSIMLNAAINPLIYGFFSPNFRAFWYRLLRQVLHRRKVILNQNTASS